jgi:type IV pilus assembly protein PilM
MNMKLQLGLGRGGGSVVGLDIQPGLVAAVQARVNGSIVAERAATMPLDGDTVREGEVIDPDALAEVLRALFKESGLGKTVRIGIANQRTVLRTLELPPVTDTKELAAAVQFQAQEQVPMPLSNAVLDFQALGIIDTPAGPRQRVVLVAAQRDMVERLLGAVSQAGLQARGVDLSAFALIRSLYRPELEPVDEPARVLYLNVDGLTNLAIAEGTTCRFTRVVGGGLESMATELAERRGVTLPEARAALAGADLTGTPPDDYDAAVSEGAPDSVALPDGDAARELDGMRELDSMREHETGATYGELLAADQPRVTQDADVWGVLESGIRDIYGEVRNSLDFHRSQDGGGDVSHVVLSGSAQDIPGFVDSLQAALGLEVRSQQVEFAGAPPADVSAHRLAVAAGLAAVEVAQ